MGARHPPGSLVWAQPLASTSGTWLNLCKSRALDSVSCPAHCTPHLDHDPAHAPLPRQVEIWQLWRRLRQEEPQLAGNLEGFLARMNSRLQEAQANKEALEQTLRK